jgi:hypothetical protein
VSLWVPPASFEAMETNLTTPAGNFGTLVTASATPHSKNTTYTELIASTAFDAYGILIMLANTFVAATDTSMLVDIAIGAAASETVIIPNLNGGFAGDITVLNVGGQKYWFPLRIPQGSRVSATAQAAVVSDDVRVSIWLYGKPLRPVWAGTQVVDYGTNMATSKGVSVAMGVSGAEGSWTQIVASTSQAHSYLAAGIACAADTTVAAGTGFLDIGKGAATERSIVENLPYGLSTNEALSYFFPFSAWAQVAPGERLAARASYTSASAGSIDCCLYGVS